MRPIQIVARESWKPDLPESLVDSLAQVADELASLECTLVAIGNPAGDSMPASALKDGARRLEPQLAWQVLRDEPSSGCVHSLNQALRSAVTFQRDVLLLNSNTLVYPGAVSEIRRVAYCDPMIGFVSPRSNNGGVCSLPDLEEYRQLPPGESRRIFNLLSPHLPEWHFVPAGAGFCLFVKLEILKEFGYFDESYNLNYGAGADLIVTDLIMRANRCGFRAALANRAFVYHACERSFSSSGSPKQAQEEVNAAKLNERYPEYVPSVQKYIDGSHYQAERLLATLIPDRGGRVDLVFDLSNLGPVHNGTFEAVKQILLRAEKSWSSLFNLYVMASPEAVRFHGLDCVEHVFIVPPGTTRTFAVAFRFGQPFETDQLIRMGRVGLINVYAMLDPIAIDCLYLNRGNLDLNWAAVFQHADGVLYISDFVAEEFRRRFPLRKGLRELVAYLSLDYKDYVDSSAISQPGNYLLVIGNAFAHKRVPATVDALAQAFPTDKIVALGLPGDDRRNVIAYPSGGLTEEQMERLWRGASVVIFPSLYEGFGLPVLKGLAHRKPMLARSIPAIRAIQKKLNADENLILYSSNDELVETLRRGFPVWKENTHSESSGEGWDIVADRIGGFLRDTLEALSFSEVLVPRLDYLRLVQRAESAQGTAEVQPVTEVWEARLRELSGCVEQLKTQVLERDQDIKEIHASWSWRLSSPIRMIGAVVLRVLGK